MRVNIWRRVRGWWLRRKGLLPRAGDTIVIPASRTCFWTGAVDSDYEEPGNWDIRVRYGDHEDKQCE